MSTQTANVKRQDRATGVEVLVAAVAASEQLSGVPRHAINLATCLLTRPEISKVHIVLGEWQLKAAQAALPLDDPRLTVHQIAIDRNAIARNLWYYRGLPNLVDMLQVDVVHLAYPVPVGRRRFRCPVVVTLHDLYPYDIPSNFGFPKVFVNRAILQQCLRAVDAIACVSESTLERLDMHAPGIAIRKASTIYNCVDAKAGSKELSALPGWSNEPLLLCVAQHRRNKNVVLAIEIFEDLLRSGVISEDTRLVVIGIDGPETARIHSFLRSSKLTSKVSLVRGVSDEELAWCYANCELLLAPSSIEGFGYPIVEAMLHHTRVVCSDIPAFREVGGSYCHYADLQPDPVKSFTDAVRIALQTHKFRSGSIEHFSSGRIGEAYMHLYTRLLHESLGTSAYERFKNIPMIEKRQAQ
jgi:glycosyltransferase involved in cell wall biosynthesis